MELDNVIRANWRGKLPLLVEGVATEYANWPTPSFLLSSRQSYLVAALENVVEELSHLTLVPETLRRIQFYHNDILLPWNLNLGVVFDCCAKQESIPFKIQIRFTAEEHMSPVKFHRIVEREFIHWFKQGMFIKYGTRLPFTDFRDDDDVKLWNAVVDGDIDTYFEVVNRMEKYEIKKLPVRVVYRIGTGDVHVRQVAIPIDSSESVQELLERLFPKLHVSETNYYCQGICLPLEIPVHDLSSLLSPDLFVYVCFHSDQLVENDPVSGVASEEPEIPIDDLEATANSDPETEIATNESETDVNET